MPAQPSPIKFTLIDRNNAQFPDCTVEGPSAPELDSHVLRMISDHLLRPGQRIVQAVAWDPRRPRRSFGDGERPDQPLHANDVRVMLDIREDGGGVSLELERWNIEYCLSVHRVNDRVQELVFRKLYSATW